MYARPTSNTKEENIESFINKIHQEIRLFVINKASQGVFFRSVLPCFVFRRAPK